MRDSKADFQLLDFAPPKRIPSPVRPSKNGSEAVSDIPCCNDRADFDPETWTGWRLVVGWAISAVTGWGLVAMTAWALFELAMWARAYW